LVEELILSVDRISVTYGQVAAVTDACLKVNCGEIVTLIGANGAGKTSLLSAISGVVKSTGQILYRGIDLAPLDVSDRVRKGVVHVPEGRQLFDRLSVRDNLIVGAHVKDRYFLEATLESVYALFPILRERADSAAGALSGGQQQMVALGRALMSDPRLMLLDEPSMGLSPILVHDIFKVLRGLQERGISVLLVEQNAHLALSAADRGYVIENGQIVLEEEASNLRSNSLVRKLYLGG